SKSSSSGRPAARTPSVRRSYFLASIQAAIAVAGTFLHCKIGIRLVSESKVGGLRSIFAPSRPRKVVGQEAQIAATGHRHDCPLVTSGQFGRPSVEQPYPRQRIAVQKHDFRVI
ncbi:hypothetical protein BKA67DRAFT_643801, partial [Truncatella angustata]